MTFKMVTTVTTWPHTTAGPGTWTHFGHLPGRSEPGSSQYTALPQSTPPLRPHRQCLIRTRLGWHSPVPRGPRTSHNVAAGASWAWLREGHCFPPPIPPWSLSSGRGCERVAAPYPLKALPSLAPRPSLPSLPTHVQLFLLQRTQICAGLGCGPQRASESHRPLHQVHGHLGCFHPLLVIMNNAALNIHIQVSVWTP